MTSQKHLVGQGRVKVGSGANMRSESFLDISSQVGSSVLQCYPNLINQIRPNENEKTLRMEKNDKVRKLNSPIYKHSKIAQPTLPQSLKKCLSGLPTTQPCEGIFLN